MDDDLRDSMRRYYDARAGEYEEAYLRGTGTASIADPDVFRREASLLPAIVERCASGRLIDLACGPGFWFPHYAPRCPAITLVDQSPRMLDECRRRIAASGALSRTDLVLADVFEYPIRPRAFDTVLVGFLISHLDEAEEEQLFARMREMLDAGGRFLILDSAWTPERARYNAKVERQQRKVNDGRSFDIYKRYIDRQDIAGWTAKHGVTISIEHFGTAFLAVSGQC